MISFRINGKIFTVLRGESVKDAIKGALFAAGFIGAQIVGVALTR